MPFSPAGTTCGAGGGGGDDNGSLAVSK
uniref:Uncharacterized protein n=1 Tax=Rhizophora mucronata TaxID=61149 RepID=A0A2P2NRE5_RHIMU